MHTHIISHIMLCFMFSRCSVADCDLFFSVHLYIRIVEFVCIYCELFVCVRDDQRMNSGNARYETEMLSLYTIQSVVFFREVYGLFVSVGSIAHSFS